jgi:hypothetical protein
MIAVAYGVDSEELAALDANFDREAFDSGESLLLAPREGATLLTGVDSVSINTGTGTGVTVPVAGFAPQGMVREYILAPTLVMSNSLLDRLVGGEAIRDNICANLRRRRYDNSVRAIQNYPITARKKGVKCLQHLNIRQNFCI